jgi:hypothetical protein
MLTRLADYLVCEASTTEELEAEVRAKCADGYIPLGGVAVRGKKLYQAIAQFERD